MNSVSVSCQWRTLLLVASVSIITLGGLPAKAVDTPEKKSSETEATGAKSDKTAEATPGKGEPEKEQKTEKTGKGASESTPKGFTVEEIVKVVEHSGDGTDADYKVTAGWDGKNVLIQTWMNPKAREIETDHKIDAVLITRALMDAFPGVPFEACKLRYFDRTERSKYIEVTVVPDVVNAYAQGGVKKSSLLTSLPFTRGETAPQTPLTSVRPPVGATVTIDGRTMKAVLPGYKYEERGRLFKKIQKLESLGVGMGSFRDSMATIEELVRDGDMTKADSKLETLDVDVTKLESAAVKAKAAAAARAASKTGGGSASASTASTAPSSIPLPPGVSKDDGNAKHYQEMKAVFGSYWPHFGPLWPDRNRIAQTLMSYSNMVPQLGKIPKIKEQLKSSAGQVTAEDLKLAKCEPLLRNLPALTTQFNQMEALVTNGATGVDAAVKRMNTSLGLSDMPRDPKYTMLENQNKEWLAGGYK
jgi:hypothetical protein